MNHHDAEISHLKERLLLMAGYAEAAVRNAMKALSERNDALASQVEADDRHLDDMEKEIDEVCLRLLTGAPLATDLRLILMATKIARDLERVGDESTTIARRVIELNSEPQLATFGDIPSMARLAIDMLHEAMDAFVVRDTARARAIVPRDKQVDALNRQLQRELASYMVEKPAVITRSLNLMTISRSIERIADHAKSIAQEVVFVYEGCDIRHLVPANGGAVHERRSNL